MATQTQEKKLVLKAIDELGRRVTPADVATKTGLPILKATTELNTIAAETNGNLQVSTTGDIAYSFGLGYQAAYLAKGMQKILQNVGAHLFQAAYFLLRISFGVMLILSFVIVIVLFLVIILSMKMGNDRDDGGGGFDFDFNFLDYLLIRDIFWWSTPPMYGNWGSYGGQGASSYDYLSTDKLQDNYHRPSTRNKKKQNFLLNCFSFLFGDGNPNLNLEERRWQVIAQVIKANNGVVTAEQLAPYTGAKPDNENAVLPTLVRFDGRPEVTETGHIVYVFPSLQVTARSQNTDHLPTYLEEFPWPFTNVSSDALIPVYIIAGFNLLGSWWLMAQMTRMMLLVMLAPLVKALVIYGTFFCLLPLLRWMTLQFLNSRIEKRNIERRKNAAFVKNATPELQTKLLEAKKYSISEKRISTSDVVYTTEKEALEQEFDPKTDKPLV
jgi:hypothetical protein